MKYEHTTVLGEEAVELLDLKPGENAIDGTVGGGGHAELMLRANAPDGKVLGMDLDPAAVRESKRRLKSFGKRVRVVQGNYRDMADAARDFEPVHGVLLDLGVSTAQLRDPKRGFSFQAEGPIDMSFEGAGKEASKIVNHASQTELERIIRTYGEERHAGRISRAIIQSRPVQTTSQLADIVKGAVPASYRRARIHPATRTFQAIRIRANRELENLEIFLHEAVRMLEPGARIAIISFHSLEDRMVKHFFRDQSRDCVCPREIPECRCDKQAMLRVITKRAVRPSEEETQKNPAARSARLRAAEKISSEKQKTTDKIIMPAI